ncbi:MAG TPA: hypothetical protein VD998_01405, partial [Verrucomicrobiae bacterium]|nr:hypothetical protein [Verrucomicrobiae bacterium]
REPKMAKSKRKRKFFSIVETLEKCTEPALTHLWEPYASGTLTSDELTKFKEHLLGCLYCASLVSNFKTVRQASEYYGLEPGPKLDRYLTKVRMMSPPMPLSERIEIARKLMTFRKNPEKKEEKNH